MDYADAYDWMRATDGALLWQHYLRIGGMEWVGRKVFERRFWKEWKEKKAELEVLEMVEGKVLTTDDGDDIHQSN